MAIPLVRFRATWHALRSCALSALGFFAPVASAAEASFPYFRFTPLAMRAEGSNVVQLSEFTFSYQGTPLSMAGVVMENPGGSNAVDAGEGANNLIDGTNAKWFDGNGQAVIFGFKDSEGAPVEVTIDAYNFATANDFSGRDPISWRLEGRAEDGDWVLLDQRVNHPTTSARNTFEAGFALPDGIEPFVRYFDLYDLGGIGIPIGSRSAIVPNGTELFVSWSTEFATEVTIEPGFGTVGEFGDEPVTPPDNADTLYTLLAANDGGSASRTVVIRTVAGGTAQHRYVRFTPTALRGGGNMIQLGELDFLSPGGAEVVPETVTNPGGSNAVDAGEGALKAIDGDNTSKWLDANRQPLIFDFGESPPGIEAYRFVTGNDAPERDPVRWVLEGSADGLAWSLIDNVTAFDYAMPLARFEISPVIPLPGASIAPVVVFNGNAPVLPAGEALTLSWTASAAATASIEPGIGSVDPAGGSVEIFPAEDTTYTITATSAGGVSASASFAVEVVDKGTDKIAYADFSSAGEELGLLRDAALVDGRLRLTPDNAEQSGEAWFRYRQSVGSGFSTSFGLHLNKPGGEDYYYGADGLAFVVQNSPTGSGAVGTGENGLPGQALNVKFDTWQNEGEPGYASLQIRTGTTILETVNLGATPGITLDPPPIEGIPTLTSRGDVEPYPVEITYVPGALNVWFQGVQVIQDLAVDLAAIGAVDVNGEAFVGFMARTGGLSHNSDITEWFLTEGAPVAPATLVLLDFSFDFVADTVALTWSSDAEKTYRVTTSDDLIEWTGISGATGIQGQASSTTATVPLGAEAKAFFRVEEE